jgi:hypothetical protein
LPSSVTSSTSGRSTHPRPDRAVGSELDFGLARWGDTGDLQQSQMSQRELAGRPARFGRQWEM